MYLRLTSAVTLTYDGWGGGVRCHPSDFERYPTWMELRIEVCSGFFVFVLNRGYGSVTKVKLFEDGVLDLGLWA